LSGYTFNENSENRESISISAIPLIAKKYIPHRASNKSKDFVRFSFSRYILDGDVLNNKLAKMLVDTTVTTNYFRVLKVDTVAMTLQARFDVSLIGTKNGNEERMRFSQCYMDIKLSKRSF
jgi:hypothetical protein